MRMAAIRIQPFSLDGILANSYPFDHNWKVEGPLELLMHNVNMFERNGPVTLDVLRTRALTSCRNTDLIFWTARQLPVHRTRFMALRQMISFCRCGNNALTK
jgi:hypothetical protein